MKTVDVLGLALMVPLFITLVTLMYRDYKKTSKVEKQAKERYEEACEAAKERLHRAGQTLAFRCFLLDIANYHNKFNQDPDKVDKIIALYNKYEFEDFVNSNKEIRLPEFYSPEEIQTLLE